MIFIEDSRKIYEEYPAGSLRRVRLWNTLEYKYLWFLPKGNKWYYVLKGPGCPWRLYYMTEEGFFPMWRPAYLLATAQRTNEPTTQRTTDQ